MQVENVHSKYHEANGTYDVTAEIGGGPPQVTIHTHTHSLFLSHFISPPQGSSYSQRKEMRQYRKMVSLLSPLSFLPQRTIFHSPLCSSLIFIPS